MSNSVDAPVYLEHEQHIYIDPYWISSTVFDSICSMVILNSGSKNM